MTNKLVLVRFVVTFILSREETLRVKYLSKVMLVFIIFDSKDILIQYLSSLQHTINGLHIQHSNMTFRKIINHLFLITQRNINYEHCACFRNHPYFVLKKKFQCKIILSRNCLNIFTKYVDFSKLVDTCTNLNNRTLTF